MDLNYIPIVKDHKQLKAFRTDEFAKSVLDAFARLYPRLGYIPPWIGYFAMHQGNLAGVAGYKGPPIENKIEIAYGTHPDMEGRGIASLMCHWLCTTALSANPDIRITARTLMEENASTSILIKTGFKFIAEVEDPEDGQVWEWELFELIKV